MNVLPTWLWTAKSSVADKDDSEQNIQVAKEHKGTETSDTISKEPSTTLEVSDSAEEAGDDNTPKGKPASIDTPVPSFALDESHTITQTTILKAEDGKSKGKDQLLIKNDTVTTVKTLPKPTAKPRASLMPPPSMKTPMRLPQRGTGGLNVPTNGPLPNRGPPQSQAAQARSSLAPTVKTPNARAKVILKPGHSPLDWATLTQSGNLSGVSSLQRVTPSILKQHNGRKGRPAWSSYQGKVYNITPYVPFHPGGEGELLRGAGKDGTKLFMEIHPWVNWENMLNSCIVGVMVSESEGDGLDEMD